MVNQALWETYVQQVDGFERHQVFVERAEEQRGNFSEHIVDKVVEDHRGKMMEISSEIMVTAMEVDGLVAELEERRATILSAVANEQFAIDELELRLAIGELDQDQFEAEVKAAREAVDTAEAQTKAIDTELEAFKDVSFRWNRVAVAAGVIIEESAA